MRYKKANDLIKTLKTSLFSSHSTYSEYVKSIQKIFEIEDFDLVWVGLKDNSWNNSENWRYSDKEGRVISEIGQIPTPYFNVHIGSSYTDVDGSVKSCTNLPTILKDTNWADCAYIYFHPGGSLGQIHKLNYVKAFVEMEIDKSTWSISNWYMISPVLKEMYPADYTNENINVFIRYFSIVKNNNQILGNWSKSVYNGDVPLTQRGMGYAFRTSYKKVTDDVTVKFRFPSIRSTFVYQSGVTINLNKTNKMYRFLMENEDNKIEKETVVTIDFDTELDPNTDPSFATVPEGCIIFGNPYMSHIDLVELYNSNSNEIESIFYMTIWELNESTNKKEPRNISFDALTLEDTGMGRYIAPFQSFLIKPKIEAISEENKLALTLNAELITTAVTSYPLK